MSIYEYDEEKHMRQEREASWGRGMGRRQTIRYKGRRRERKIVRQTGTSKGTDSKRNC